MVEAESTKEAANVDDQVEKRMQRLNLYFEKENVGHIHAQIFTTTIHYSFIYVFVCLFVWFFPPLNFDAEG